MLKFQIFGTVVLGASLAFEVSLAYFYFIDSGCELVEGLQNYSNRLLDGVWWFLNFATLPFLLKIVLISFYLGSRTIGMELVTVSVSSVMTGNILKFLIAYPRPFWYSQEIEGKACELDFGDPSTHMILSFTILVYSVWRFKKPNFLYSLIVFFLMLVFFERTYGGLHTFSQLLLGLVVGMYLVLIFTEYNKELNSCVKGLKQKPVNLQISVIIALCITFPLLLIYIRNPWWQDQWNENVEQDCSDFNVDIALRSQFLDCLYIFYFLGAALGFYFLTQAKINLKKSANWKKMLVIGGCFSTHFLCRFGAKFGTGVFVADVFVVSVLDFVEGFLCFGGICLPFRCLKEVRKEEEKPLKMSGENSNDNF